MWFKKRRTDAMSVLGLTLEGLTSHCFAIGASGSGKTSVLRILMSDVLQHHVGLLWCCVKNDEAQNAFSVIGSSPARNRLLHLVPGKFTFNFLAYELSRPGGSPDSAVRLLGRLNDQLMRTGGRKDESFWENLFYKYLHASITVAWLAHDSKVTLEHVYNFVTSTPSSYAQAQSDQFAESPCFQMLALAENNLKNDADKRAYQLALTFILREQLELGSKPRSAGVSQCSSVLSPFLLSPLYETVCAEKSSFTPDMPLKGWCAVLDFPVLTFKQGGVLFQSLITMMTMEAALRRSNPDSITAIVRDEYQMLVADPEFESMVQSVARSHKLACISATQNLPLLQSALGGDSVAEQHMLALFANYNTKLVLANACSRTNAYFCEAWGQHREQFISVNETDPEKENELMSLIFGSNQYRFSTGEQLVPRVTPDQFLTLRRGGTEHRFLIDAFLTQGGRRFNGDPFKIVTFSQR